MILLSSSRFKFFFSLQNKFYDVICIGNAAQKVANLVEQQNKKISFRKLFIKSSDVQYESSLAIFGKSQIQISTKISKNTDTRLRNEISRVDPSKNILILGSGQQIKFKRLIYSGEDSQWKDMDCVKGLKWALESPYTSTFADIQGSRVEKLYNKINSDIYFSISSQRHFGMDNYFMVHLADHLRKLSKISGFDPADTRIKILNRYDKLVPYNKELDESVKNLLSQNKIEIINNCTVESINHIARQFTLINNGKQQKTNYGGFYQYLPFKIPQFLSKSQIDPFNVDQNTLQNKQFPTIHIIGNILPTVFSYYGLNYMNHVIAKNIVNMELKSNKQAVYQGDTIFPFWTGSNTLRYFKMNYQTTKFPNNIGSNKYAGLLLGLDRKLLGDKQVSMYFNHKSYGIPFYITSPRLHEVNKTINANHVEDKRPLTV